MRLALLYGRVLGLGTDASLGQTTASRRDLTLSKTPNMWAGTGCEAGCTLVELLVVILIIGILSAVALPLYLGYTRDARLAEAKALAGSALTALSGCVQVKGAGQSCVRSDVAQRVGLDTGSFNTYDGRWNIPTAQLTVTSSNPPQLLGQVSVSGVGGNAAGMSLSMFGTATGVVLRCREQRHAAERDQRRPGLLSELRSGLRGGI